MTKTMTRLADRALARIAPRVEASAGCSYYEVRCYCIYRVGYYSKQCISGCSQIPSHCTSCTLTGSCG